MEEMPHSSFYDKPEGEHPRRINALLTYLHPFRLVKSSKSGTWEANIDVINSSSWDYAKLHEIVGGIDVGLKKPYHLVVGFDGALALPPIKELQSVPAAVEFFNRCLASFLIGGIYCEAITLDNIEHGSIIDWMYIRSLSPGRAFSNQLHFLLRMKMAPPIMSVALCDPNIIELEELIEAGKIGSSILASLPELSPEFLLKGTSAIGRRDWGSALSNLWIIAEQITEHLWKRHVGKSNKKSIQIPGRTDQLADHRTWTASVKQEVLYQKDILSSATLKALFMARKTRNDLLHKGRHPQEEQTLAAYEAVEGLFQAALPNKEIPLFKIDIQRYSLRDPFQVPKREKIDPKFWMPIPKLPGEAELERYEAEQRRSTY